MIIITDDLMPDENLTWRSSSLTPSEMVGIAPVEWANSNPDQIMEWMGVSAETGISLLEQIYWENDDDNKD